jgi:hypothetical protein
MPGRRAAGKIQSRDDHFAYRQRWTDQTKNKPFSCGAAEFAEELHDVRRFVLFSAFFASPREQFPDFGSTSTPPPTPSRHLDSARRDPGQAGPVDQSVFE